MLAAQWCAGTLRRKILLHLLLLRGLGSLLLPRRGRFHLSHFRGLLGKATLGVGQIR